MSGILAGTSLMKIFIVLVIALVLESCATVAPTKATVWRHPATGQIEFCPYNTANFFLAYGASGGRGADSSHAACAIRLRQAGYERVPMESLDQADRDRIQAELDRYDAARADSIQKPTP